MPRSLLEAYVVDSSRGRLIYCTTSFCIFKFGIACLIANKYRKQGTHIWEERGPMMRGGMKRGKGEERV